MLASEILDDPPNCDCGDSHQLIWWWKLQIGKKANQYDGDDPDSTSDGIGDAKRNVKYHFGTQPHW